MKARFIRSILLFTCFVVILPSFAFAASGSPDTHNTTINSTKNMMLLEPATLLLLTLGGGGIVFLNKRKSKS